MSKQTIGLMGLSMAAFGSTTAQAMLESAGTKKGEPEKKEPKKDEPEKTEKDEKGAKKKKAIFEAVEARAAQDSRALAASLVTGWATDGSPDADDFDALAINMAGLGDIDENTDLTDDQVDAYNDALSALASAAVSLGADQDDVTSMINDEDDDAAERVYDAINANVSPDDSDDAVAEYSVADGADDDAMFESTIKVVRNGVVTLIKKRLRPRRMTSLQKAALRKAQSKAHSSSGKMAFRRSMKLRAKRGL
ncbi:hypothetical protein [Tatumella sp. OPLPL6]|uniref:hypothetical protein n=1 Tax=Tatumella sp. OPLPL6 TaxID=1928657 RepID=UPI000C1909F4|nr:hypothetical protein [Tatumella sp. OPLPL6]PIJ43325.1 hypothetical protein BOM24_09155 [Tatumella sp. OPLPL6]